MEKKIIKTIERFEKRLTSLKDQLEKNSGDRKMVLTGQVSEVEMMIQTLKTTFKGVL